MDMLEHELHNGGVFVGDEPLFLKPIAKRDIPCQNLMTLLLSPENIPDPLARPVGFFLGDGEADMEMEPAAGRRGIIHILRALPADAMRFKNILHLVIVLHISEPSVEALHHDNINLSGFHVTKEPLQLLSGAVRLSSRYALVGVHARHGVLVGGSILE